MTTKNPSGRSFGGHEFGVEAQTGTLVLVAQRNMVVLLLLPRYSQQLSPPSDLTFEPLFLPTLVGPKTTSFPFRPGGPIVTGGSGVTQPNQEKPRPTSSTQPGETTPCRPPQTTTLPSTTSRPVFLGDHELCGREGPPSTQCPSLYFWFFLQFYTMSNNHYYHNYRSIIIMNLIIVYMELVNTQSTRR